MRSQMHHVRASTMYLAERAVFIVAGLAFYAIAARFLGPTRFGTFTYAQNIAQLILPSISVGCEAIVVRELVRNPAQSPAIMGSAAVVMAALGLVAVSLPIVYVFFFNATATPEIYTTLALSA